MTQARFASRTTARLAGSSNDPGAPFARMMSRSIDRRTVLAGLALAPLAGAAVRSVHAQDEAPLAVMLAAIRGVGRETSPWGVAVDDDGFLFVADSRTSRLVRISPDGSELLTIVGKGDAAGFLSRPKGVAIGPDGLLYVVDGGHRRIQVFTRDGALRNSWGSRGGGPGEFNAPRGIALDADGFVYVADGFNDRVQKFESDGSFVGTWGSRGREPGEFSTPNGIAVGPAGLVYVADTFRDRVQVFTPEGEFWRFAATAPEVRNPVGVAVDQAARVYVTEEADHRVAVFEPDGSLAGRFGGEGSGGAEFRFPQGLAVDFDGRIYVADSLNGRVQIFDSPLSQLAPPRDAEDLAVGVALDAAVPGPLRHSLTDWRVRLDGMLLTVGFAEYFGATGGLRRWGWPTSDPLRESPDVISQWFQRGVMDWNLDTVSGTRKVFARPVWDLIGGGRGGAPNLGIEPTVLSDQQGMIVGTWGHRVSNVAIDGTVTGFLDFFEAFGGALAFGAPRTEARPDTGAPGTIIAPGAEAGVIRQYFQNAVLESWPGSREPVQLRLLGDALRNRQFPNDSWRLLAPFADAEFVQRGDTRDIPHVGVAAA